MRVIAYYARQPIYNLRNDTYGYELLYRSAPEVAGYNHSNGDAATADVINSSFFGGDPHAMFEQKKLFVNFTENLLINRTALLLPSDMLIVEILESVPFTDEIAEACKELKDEGYRIALDDFELNSDNEGFLAYADIVKIDMLTDKDKMQKTAAACRKRGIRILAEKVETEDDLNFAKELGAVFFQGYYYSKPIIVSQSTATPLQTTFLRLVSKLNYENVELREVSNIIETDAVMTLKFLRFINSIRYDWMNKVTSVFQAVILAGIRRTKEFIYFIGLHQINLNSVDELITTGFFRAKFCSIVGEMVTMSSEQADEMYLMGLMSVVADGRLNINASTVESLPVSAAIKAGLRGEEGVYTEVYNLVIAYEKADWGIVDAFCSAYHISANSLADAFITCIQETKILTKGI